MTIVDGPRTEEERLCEETGYSVVPFVFSREAARTMTFSPSTVRSRIRRAFANILENAIDAMPQGGTLEISSEESDGSVHITFSDTRTGIPKEVVENLWKPLQTTEAKGIGLGLAICKRLVDAHNGTISVESTVGKGTTLTVGIPTKPKSEASRRT
jgi:signal transduction histidine kinase